MSKLNLKCDFVDMQTSQFGNQTTITFRLHGNGFKVFDELKEMENKGKGLRVEVDVWREKRSLDANAYCWVLLDKIASEIKSTKEDVYLSIIHEVGVYEVLPIKDVAVERFVKSWEKKGLGWCCEVLGKSKIKDYTNVVAYYGTSTYDSKEMARFIDEVVSRAKELNLETRTSEEIAKMKSLWGQNG